MSLKYFTYDKELKLESGEKLPAFEIAYNTFGTKDNAKKTIWICHTFTSNSDPTEWWSDIVGKAKLIDTDKYFIVCANILGSAYGSTNPLSINKKTGKQWYRDFPLITFKDLVSTFSLLADYLCIDKIDVLIGASIGGCQAIEWAVCENDRIRNLILIATNAKSTPWNIAINCSQRLAIEADYSFFDDKIDAGKQGLKAARSIALLSYRTEGSYNKTQKEAKGERLDKFRADSYQRYQGEKLANRFDVYSYYSLTKMHDTHDVGRGRISLAEALKRISARTLVVGITSDILFSCSEQKALSACIENSQYAEIESDYGHDAFLIESDKLISIINNFNIE